MVRAIRALVALEEECPVRGADLGADLADERHAGLGEPAPLLPDLLALVVVERRQEIGEIAVAAVAPVELQAVAHQHARRRAFARLRLVDEQHVQRRDSRAAVPPSARSSSARRVVAIVREQARPGHRRERHRRDELRVVAPAVAPVRVGPAPVEHVFAIAVRLRVQRHRADQLSTGRHAVRKRGGQPVRATAQPRVVQRGEIRVRQERQTVRKPVPFARRNRRQRHVVADQRRNRDRRTGLRPGDGCVHVVPDCRRCAHDAQALRARSGVRATIMRCGSRWRS